MSTIVDVFISYSRHNITFVRELEKAVRTQGRERAVWIDWHGIPPKADWLKEIYDAIESSQNFLIVISPDALASEVVNQEIAHAIGCGKSIIPVIFRDIDERAMASEWFEKAWESTARANWTYLKHLNWIFCRLGYSPEELAAFREAHPGQAEPPVDRFEEAMARVIEAVELDLDQKEMHTRMTLAAEAWSQQGRRDDSLLHGVNADTAWDWLTTSGNKSPAPTALQREFISLSLDRQRRREREEQARQRRFNRLAWTLVGGLVLLLILVVILAVVANDRRRVAEKAEAEAIRNVELTARVRDQTRLALANAAETLATVAMQRLTSDPVSSLDLAIQALEGPPGAEHTYVPMAELALNRALQTSLERAYVETGGVLVAVNPRAKLVAAGGEKLVVLPLDLEGPTPLQLPPKFEPVGITWSIDGRIAAYGGRTVAIWYAGNPVDQVSLEDPVGCLDWHPDGGELAVCSGGQVFVWEPGEALGDPLFELDGPVQAVTWSPDGHYLAAWDQRRGASTLAVWDREAGAMQRRIDQPTGWFRGAVWSGAGLLTWSRTSEPGGEPLPPVWWPPDGEPPVPLEGHADHVTGGRWLNDTDAITWDLSGEARLWRAGELVRVFGKAGDLPPQDRGTAALRGVASNGTRLLTFRDDGVAHLWDIETGELLASLRGHDGAILAAAWHGDYVATAGADGTVRLWDTRPAGGQAVLVLSGHTAPVEGLYWTDADELITWSLDRTLRRWTVFDRDGVPLCDGWDPAGVPYCRAQARVLARHDAGITDLRWPAAGSVLTADSDGEVRVALPDSDDTTVYPVVDDHGYQVVFSQDGQTMLRFDYDSDGWVVDLATGATLFNVEGPIDNGFALTGGGWLIGYYEGSARLLRDGHDVTLQKQEAGLIAAAASPDGTQVAAIDVNGRLGLWDTTTGTRLDSGGSLPEAHLSAVAWSQDGTGLFVAGQQTALLDAALVPVWGPFETGAALGTAKIVLSPTGDRVAIAITDWETNRLRIYDTVSGEVLFETGGFETQVSGVAWSAAGTRLLAWGQEGSSGQVVGFAQIWDLATNEPVHLVHRPDVITTGGFHEGGFYTGDAGGAVLFWQTAPTPEKLVALARACCVTR